MNDVKSHTVMVYVVDDDPAVRDSLSTLFYAYGLNVEAYDSVAAFKKALRPTARGCLILDQHMPVLTGLEFLGSAEGKALDLPVVLITAHNDEEIRAQAKDVGVFAFLAKPVEVDALMAIIGRAMAHSNRTHPAC